jgi:hypothetical protein
MKLDLLNRKIESCLEDGYLCRDKIIQWLEGVVDRARKTVNWPQNITVRTVSCHYNNPLTYINFWSLYLLEYWEAFPKAIVPRTQSLLLRSVCEFKNVWCFSITYLFIPSLA